MPQAKERVQRKRSGQSVAELDIVIPALNEETRLGATLSAISTMASDSGLSLNIIVVDNGCVDGTAEVVALAQEAALPVQIMSCGTRGKGAAVRAGIHASTARYVGYCDADLSTPPSAVSSGIELLRSGWEVVIGSRRCAGAGYAVRQGNLRRFGSFVFRKMSSDLSGPISDTQCGFKLFHADVAKALFSGSRLTGFAFDIEVLARARNANFSMIELPIQWTDSPDSSFRPVKDGIRSFRELREIRRTFGTAPAPEWR